jgi:hypothetical protein
MLALTLVSVVLLKRAAEIQGRTMVDAKDEAVAAFYRYHAFTELPDSPLTLFLPLETARRAART